MKLHAVNALIPQNHHRVEVVDDEDDKIRLEILDLSGLSLNKYSPHPPIILAAICKLDLSNNNLHDIPGPVIDKLVNVISLDVHSNQLTSLPNSIGGLFRLKILNVSSNLFRYLPKSILNCRRLEEVSANFNKLAALPETFGLRLPNLKKLSANSNQLSSLPESTCHLTALRVLDVRLNCLQSLPEDIEKLVNLEVLNASQNFHHLTKLPSSIGLMKSLSELDVSYNEITVLPPSMGFSSTKLKTVRVQGNPLVCPPMHIVDMGLHTVRLYLTGAVHINANHSHKHKSWYRRHFNKHSVVASPAHMRLS